MSLAASALAGNEVPLKLAWDPSPTPAVIYRVIYAAGGASSFVETGATSITLTLRHNTTYTIQCVAIDGYGQWAPPSNTLTRRVRK